MGLDSSSFIVELAYCLRLVVNLVGLKVLRCSQTGHNEDTNYTSQLLVIGH